METAALFRSRGPKALLLIEHEMETGIRVWSNFVGFKSGMETKVEATISGLGFQGFQRWVTSYSWVSQEGAQISGGLFLGAIGKGFRKTFPFGSNEDAQRSFC